MKLDTILAVHDLCAVADYARIAEDIGFDALWTTETQHDPFLPLAVASTTTQQLKLGTAVEGTPEAIPDKLQAKYDGILDRITVYHPFQPGEHEERWRKFARAFNG